MRYGTIEILVGASWVDMTEEILGRRCVLDGYTKADARVAVANHYLAVEGKGHTLPQTNLVWRVVWTETIPPVGGSR